MRANRTVRGYIMRCRVGTDARHTQVIPMTYEWHDLVGNLGVLCILGTYLALQLQRMDPQGYAYSIINGMGAVLIMVSLYFDFNLSSFVIEVFWLLISILGIIRRLLGRTAV